MRLILIITCIAVLMSCQDKHDGPQGDWIKGSEEEKIKIIEKQFRGFDNAMIEIGYRYQELYWAGLDSNWEYANYQADKIKLAMEQALQRRPLRAKSSTHFLDSTLPEMKKAIEKRDTGGFRQHFNALTASCNSCHAMEKVSYFNVKVPTERISPISR